MSASSVNSSYSVQNVVWMHKWPFRREASQWCLGELEDTRRDSSVGEVVHHPLEFAKALGRAVYSVLLAVYGRMLWSLW